MARGDNEVRLFLLGGLRLELGRRDVELPPTVGRLLACLALHAPGRIERLRLAVDLWPDCEHVRAMANLRTALWRVRRLGEALVQATKRSVQLHPSVWIDVADPASIVDRHDSTVAVDLVLLPEFEDDWIVVERERMRHRVLLAVEERAREHVDCGEHASAVEAALTAIRLEPLRETSRRLAIEALLLEGDTAAALRQFDQYSDLLDEELHISPSTELASLVAEIRSGDSLSDALPGR